MKKFPNHVFESNILQSEPHLILRGKVANSIFEKVKSGLIRERKSNWICFFVGFAELDVHIGQEFEVIFAKDDVSNCVQSKSVLIDVTQQFGASEEVIHHGWKTICIISFPNGIPQIIQEQPTIEDWYDPLLVDLYLSSKKFWQDLKTIIEQ